LLTGAGYLLLLPQQWVRRNDEPARFIPRTLLSGGERPTYPAAAQEVSIFMGAIVAPDCCADWFLCLRRIFKGIVLSSSQPQRGFAKATELA